MARPIQRRKPSLPTAISPKEVVRLNGLPAVLAAFSKRPDDVERLFFEPRHAEAVKAITQAQTARRKPYRMVENEELTRIAGTPLHGGVVAHVAPLPLPDAQAPFPHENVLILDGVGNPHNLGAIIRTMAFFGLKHVLLSDHPAQALPSDAAYRIAEGGMEWVTAWRLRDLPKSLPILARTHRVIATALGGHQRIEDVLVPGDKPIALILGNEENGISPAILAACPTIATLSGSGQVQSLNVSVTAAILIHLLKSAQ